MRPQKKDEAVVLGIDYKSDEGKVGSQLLALFWGTALISTQVGERRTTTRQGRDLKRRRSDAIYIRVGKFCVAVADYY